MKTMKKTEIIQSVQLPQGVQASAGRVAQTAVKAQRLNLFFGQKGDDMLAQFKLPTATQAQVNRVGRAA